MGEYENGQYIPDALELSDLRAAGRIPVRAVTTDPIEEGSTAYYRCEQCARLDAPCTHNPWKEDYDEYEERQEYKHDEH